jgi:hypothetical protein
MTRGTRRFPTLPFLSATLLLAASAGLASAESSCKGIEQSVCSNRADCVWVGSYTRGDGARVNGYCRAKSGKSKKGDAGTPSSQATETSG